MSTIVWDGNKMLEEHRNFSENLPVAEIIESQTSKSCKDSNILIFIRCNKMEFQDWMEEYIFHIILLQKYEYALYFTIEERRFYQQRKKKDIWGKATKKSNSRQAGTIFQIFGSCFPNQFLHAKRREKTVFGKIHWTPNT